MELDRETREARDPRMRGGQRDSRGGHDGAGAVLAVESGRSQGGAGMVPVAPPTRGTPPALPTPIVTFTI